MRRLRSIAVLVTLVSAVVLVLTAKGPSPVPRPFDVFACAGAQPRVPPSDWCPSALPQGSPTGTPTPTSTPTPWPWVSQRPTPTPWVGPSASPPFP